MHRGNTPIHQLTQGWMHINRGSLRESPLVMLVEKQSETSTSSEEYFKKILSTITTSKAYIYSSKSKRTQV